MPKKRWIQAALSGSKRGALHRQLGLPVGEKIPLSTLRAAAKKGSTKLARRARLAITLRGLGKKKRKTKKKRSR